LPKPAVIVVSSHVARGAVGGRASVFVLERMGFPIWSLPTVLLPWHPGHGRASRLDLGGANFAGLVADLAGAAWLGEVGGILTGYFGGVGQVAAAAQLVRALKEKNPAALFLCDPVIGDSAGIFVPEAIAHAIRDQLLPLADIATPNRFELAWLASRPAADNEALVAAARKLGPSEVAVTSAFALPGEIGTLLVAPDGAHLATHRALDDVPHGTGDLFAALYLGHRLDGQAAPAALECASAAVLRLVSLASEQRADELPLAMGQDAFLAPATGITLERLS
jgi:pyridoxine kinase